MNALKSIQFLEALSSCTRYSNTRLLIQENVMEHTACVSFICSQLGLEVLDLMKQKCITPSWDMGELLMKALWHDAEETVTGDVLRTVKYHSPEVLAAFQLISREGMKKTLQKLDMTDATAEVVYDTWDSAKDGQTGCIVSIADLASVMYKVHQEVLMLGNLNMMTSIENFPGYVTDLYDKVRRVFNHEHSIVRHLHNYLGQIECLYKAAQSKAMAEFNHVASCVKK